jgi:hypothetical protein
MLTGNRHSIVPEHAKGIKIWAQEGRLGHVEVFLQMCCFSTSIFGRPRLFLSLQHTPITKPIYTQNPEEPLIYSARHGVGDRDGLVQQKSAYLL